MSGSTRIGATEEAAPHPISDKLNAGIIGFVLGAGAMFLAVQYYGYRLGAPAGGRRGDAAQEFPVAVPPPGFYDAAMAGASSPRRDLTALVGKLELCSRDDLRLKIEFEAAQAAEVAAELTKLERLERLTPEEAQGHVETLQALLTEEQTNVLNMVSLPRPPANPPAGALPGMADANPFGFGRNHIRLQDLLARLKRVGEQEADR